MTRQTLGWLYRELPELVSQGIISPEVAERIRQHYGEPKALGGSAKRWATILFSILGAVLIGGGIILLLAHNWEELSRPMRALISVLPLSVSAALGGWLLMTQRASTAWREGVGTFQTISIGVAISLIAQTYNLSGSFGNFILTWSLLGLPVAYLLRSTLPALLYLIGITVWTTASEHYGLKILWYFPLVGLALPYLWLTSRTSHYHPRPVLFAWVLAITLCIAIPISMENLSLEFHSEPMFLGGLFGLLLLVGSRWWADASTVWQRPFQTVGAVGGFGLALIMSYSDSWQYYSYDGRGIANSRLLLAIEVAVVFIIMVAAIALWVWSWVQRSRYEVMLGAVSILSLFGWSFTQFDLKIIAVVLFNLYLCGLGIGTLVIGLKGRKLSVVNTGMAVLSSVIWCRFFDADLSFLLRGLAFIAIGIGFLATNLLMLYWKGDAQS
jgi:uncharacterized membrane protein